MTDAGSAGRQIFESPDGITYYFAPGMDRFYRFQEVIIMVPRHTDFEKKMQKLERIVQDLEKGELSLEKGVKLFKEGLELTRSCREQLEQARHQLTIYSRQDGEKDFEAGTQ